MFFFSQSQYLSEEGLTGGLTGSKVTLQESPKEEEEETVKLEELVEAEGELSKEVDEDVEAGKDEEFGDRLMLTENLLFFQRLRTLTKQKTSR